MTPRRRTFLGWLTGGLGALVGATIAWPLLRLVASPLARPTVTGGEEPVRVADLAALPEGEPVRASVVVPTRRDAWLRLDHVPLGAVWLVRRGDAVTAFSTTCPHAGCFVDWEAAAKQFHCPCHGSVFSVDGTRTAGPSPRAMDTLAVEVKDGGVYVTFRRFRQATPAKEVV